MKISIGNDHAGTEHKFAIIKLLQSKKIDNLETKILPRANLLEEFSKSKT